MPGLAPKAYLNGFTLPADFELPTIESVRNDVAFVPTLLANNGKNANVGMLNPRTHENFERLPEPLIYNSMVPNLFKFSYFTLWEDIPNDLLDSAIWVLEMYARPWDEATEQDLRATGHIPPGNGYETAKYLASLNIRWKIARHLLNYKINRPADAIPYLRALVETDQSSIPKATVWGIYGEALARSGSDDKEAQIMLELALQAPGTRLPVDMAVRVRIFLARVLHRLNLDTKAIEHENWVIKWFRKNPTLMEDTALRNLLMPEEDYNDAILEQLGGKEWLANRKTTFKTNHNESKGCRQCEARSTQKPLFKCSRCKHIYYCSRECQRKDWPTHKESCNDIADCLKNIEKLSLLDPAAGQKAELWHKWRVEADKSLIHALGLHHDPSRSRTHIAFKRIKYTPKASKDLRYKFHIDEMGVYKISDVMPEIESIMCLRPGEGREYIDGLFEDIRRLAPDGSEIPFPMIDLAFGDNLVPWLGSKTVSRNGLTFIPYDPEWRESLNILGPPRAFKFPRAGVKDQEHIFDN
ncbi:hypothetical protein M422DRAFT_259068 [Sphaerobolus stellatus SS14]|uniref:Unplaced genomic scaffold SPHSTscaffold_86, whole genome shotgun sequence n=1 Tax=Sphaerobolus stellatus (strain SS14) TaxID=990650 RepID=A0A0C9VLI9_SPHS4|nr:hypothetical protein M422DRAFT_259068 [Sphaerobolus stellatus SS14]